MRGGWHQPSSGVCTQTACSRAGREGRVRSAPPSSTTPVNMSWCALQRTGRVPVQGAWRSACNSGIPQPPTPQLYPPNRQGRHGHYYQSPAAPIAQVAVCESVPSLAPLGAAAVSSCESVASCSWYRSELLSSRREAPTRPAASAEQDASRSAAAHASSQDL